MIVPAELDETGTVMYAGGLILLRGRQVGTSASGRPLYEWWPA